MVEVLVIAALVAVGAVVLQLTGARDTALITAAALPLGCGIFSVSLLVVVPLRTPAVGVLAVLATVAVAAAAVAAPRRSGWRGVGTLAVAVAGNGLLAGLLQLAPAVNVSPDSLRYAASASIIGRTSDLSEVGTFLLATRQWTLPAVHGLASVGDEVYLRSLSPLLALSGLALLAWFGRRLITLDAVPVAVGGAVLLLTVCLILTNNRFAYHAFYLNGHMLFAVFALLVAGSVLLCRRGDSVIPTPALVVLGAVPVAALAPLRPEAPLVALLLVAPLLVARTVPVKVRLVPAVALGAVTLWWNILLWHRHVAEADAVPPAVPGLVVVGAALLVVGATLRWWDRLALSRWLLPAHIGLWVVFAVAAMRDPATAIESVRATVRNQAWDGLWGSSLVILGLLVVGLLVLRRWPAQSVFAFPLISFVPLAGLLALVRDAGAYRVGPGDSLNRMLLHVLLVGALALVAAVGSRPRRLPLRFARSASPPHIYSGTGG